jgi:hypothetical protein
MSFLKYANQPGVKAGNGRGPLNFSRVHLDGAPFRGTPPMLKADEFSEYTETVYDANVDLFDLTDPAQKKKLQEIIDHVANNVYRVLRYDHHWYTKENGEPGLKVYMMWCSAQKELATHRLPPGLANSMTGGVQ